MRIPSRWRAPSFPNGTEAAETIGAGAIWREPLTLVLPKHAKPFPDIVTAGLVPTVGIRVPAHPRWRWS